MTVREALVQLIRQIVREEAAAQVGVWATVTQASPLLVKLDSDTDPLDITTDTLVAGLAVNDRVWVQLVTNSDPASRSRRVVVIGKAT